MVMYIQFKITEAPLNCATAHRYYSACLFVQNFAVPNGQNGLELYCSVCLFIQFSAAKTQNVERFTGHPLYSHI